MEKSIQDSVNDIDENKNYCKSNHKALDGMLEVSAAALTNFWSKVPTLLGTPNYSSTYSPKLNPLKLNNVH
jgi:hypothetical protein